MKTLYKFVDDYSISKGLHFNPEARKKAVLALKVAGFSDSNPPDARETLAYKVVRKAVESDTPVERSHVGPRVTTAAVVSAGQNCPRCGSSMTDVLLSNDVPGRYCTNPRCRVSCYRA